MRHRPLRLAAPLFLALFLTAPVMAATVTVEMRRATLDNTGDVIGTITINETEYGLLFVPNLRGLEAGVRGFHIHENGQCGPGPDASTGEMIPAGAAGGHWDPDGAKRHGSPWTNDGHKGDLPPLYVTQDGAVTTPVLAPRLRSISEIAGKSLMIHDGGDNFSDSPKPNGGGGGRIACGTIGR